MTVTCDVMQLGGGFYAWGPRLPGLWQPRKAENTGELAVTPIVGRVGNGVTEEVLVWDLNKKVSHMWDKAGPLQDHVGHKG